MKRIINLALLSAFLISALSASCRVSAGGSFMHLGSYGLLAGEDYGVRRIASSAPAIALEAEFEPCYQLSVFMQGVCAPYWPLVKSNGDLLPLQKTFSSYKHTAFFFLGCGWMLPLSYWTKEDFPIEISAGAGCSISLFGYGHETAYESYKAIELAYSAGFYETFSWYFTDTFGLSLSAIESFSLGDTSSFSLKKTAGSMTKTSLTRGIPVVFNMSATLSLSVRFGTFRY